MHEDHHSICKTAFYPLRSADNLQDTLLIVFNCVVAILNLSANSMVVYTIVKTRQFHNSSIKLILMLSCSDILTAVVSQPLHVYLQYDNSLPCDINIVLQFLFFFFPYLSVYIIAFIVFDRYARVTYLSKYDSYMTRSKFTIGVFLVVCATTIQDIVVTVATLRETSEIGGIGVLPLNVITLVFEVAVYTKTIYKLRSYKLERRKSLPLVEDSSLTNLAAAYLLMIIIFFTPFMVINTVYTLYPKTTPGMLIKLQYGWLVCQVFYCFNSFANAMLFLRVNRKARVRVKLFIQRCMKLRVAPAQTSSHRNSVFFMDMYGLKRDKSNSVASNNNIIMIRRESTAL